MKTNQKKSCLLLTSLLCSVLIVSCDKTSTSETETTVGNYEMPKTIPLQFTDPEPFEWETISSDTLTTPVTYTLNLDEVPSQPFKLNTFKPLVSPMAEYEMDWNNYPSQKLKFDSIPFTINKATIRKPNIVKMRPPGLLDGGYTNLMQLSQNEGLPSNEIKAMLKNDAGTWIATRQSLNLYDGDHLFNYDFKEVNDMIYDDRGRLWLATFRNDIYVLDFANDIEYTINVQNAPLPLIDILHDHSDTIYVMSWRDGVYKMDTDFKSLEKLAFKNSNETIVLFEDSQHNIWLSQDKNIAMIDNERKSIKTVPESLDFNLRFGLDIIEDASGTIWISNGPIEEVVSISLKENKAKKLTNENGYDVEGTRIMENESGELWVAGNDRAFVLNKDRSHFKIIATNSTMRTNGRGCLFKSNDGSIWIGSLDKGVVMTNPLTSNIQYLDDTKGLMNNEVWEILVDSYGDIWLGTAKGIHIIEADGQSIKTLSHSVLHNSVEDNILFMNEISKDKYLLIGGSGFSIYDRELKTITYYAQNSVNPLRIFGYVVLNDDTLFLYTPIGICLYNIKSNSLKKLSTPNDLDGFDTINQSLLAYDQKNIVWLPTRNGLTKIDLSQQTISYLREAQGLCHNETNVALISKEDDVWLTTLKGIGILNLKENTLTNLTEKNGFIPSETYDLIERDSIMYVATVNGLIPIKKSSATTINTGFPNFNGGFGFKANDYLEGSGKFLDDGQFWSGVATPSSDFKLMILDKVPKIDSTTSKAHITNLYVMDEEPGFNGGSQSDSIKPNANTLQWTSTTSPYHIPENLVLPFDQNSLSFSYGSSDIYNRDQLTYRFILEGADSDWIYAETTTKTKNYYNLKPGDYSFKVAARGFNKQWSKPDTLAFSIAPPWWQTWWAYLLFGLVLGTVIWSLAQYRSRWLKKENRVLEERVNHRTEQLKYKIDQLKATQSQLIQSEKMASLGELTAGIAHEIQNPLNFVNNFSEINVELIDEMQAEMKKGDYEEAFAISEDVKDNQQKINHHGKRADGIVKGMLQHSRSSSSTKEPSDINAIADEYLRLAYHGLRAKDKSFNASMETDFDPSIGKINIVPQDVGRVILNLITNAFYACTERKRKLVNHMDTTYQPKVWVGTKNVGNDVHVIIRDNGGGIPKEVKDKVFQPFFTTKPAGEGTGLGLSLSYDIIKTHGGEMKLDTIEGEGTTFTLILPKA